MVINFLSLAAAPGGQGNLTQMLIMFGFVAVFFYFVLLRPERKKRKAMETMRNSMKKGDKATAMGILGTVDKVLETTVVLKMVDGAKIEVLKGAISEIQPQESAHKVVVEETKEISSSN